MDFADNLGVTNRRKTSSVRGFGQKRCNDWERDAPKSFLELVYLRGGMDFLDEGTQLQVRRNPLGAMTAERSSSPVATNMRNTWAARLGRKPSVLNGFASLLP